MRVALAFAALSAALVSAGETQEVRSAGATDWFGRGIVAVRQSGTEIRLELRTGAQGMMLRVVEGEPITIVAVGPFAAGESVVRLPARQPVERVTPTVEHSAIAVSTSRQPMPVASLPREAPQEYLLLVLTDRAPDSTVIGRIRSIPGFDPATAAHDLTEYIVGRQSPMWAGYLARR